MNDIESILLTTMSNDISICKVEKFDINMAMWLLNQSDILTSTEKTRLRKMFKNRTKGNCFEAYYKLGKEAEGTLGRFCIKNGIGLQGLSRDPRAALAYPFYWDLDFQNCQCQIALQECKRQGWICTNLEYYCNNREQLFKDFQAENELYTRDFIKQEFLSLMFGKEPCYNTPKWIKEEFYPELNNFMKNICNAYPKLYAYVKKRKSKNPLGSTCAFFLQGQERRCLMAFDNFLNQNKRYMGMYLHDGGYVEKLPGELEFPKELIEGAENFIFETTGLRLKIVNKPIETSFNPTDRRVLNPDKTYPMIKSMFELKNFKCIANGCYYEILDDEILIRTRTDLKNSFEHLVYEQEDKNGFVEDCSFIDKWIKDKDIRVYDKVDLYPPPLKCPDNHFNLWTGYEIENISINDTYEAEYIQQGFDFIINHWKLLSSDNYFDYFLKFIAYTVQYPALKPLIAIYINSKPGLGKERGLYYIFQQIFGLKYCLITENMNDVFGDFNGLIENKIIIVLDELKISNSSKYQESIKSIITQDYNKIHNKNIKKYNSRNSTHLFGFSNTNGFKVEEGCRRTFAVDRWEISRPGPEYIEKLLEYTDNKVIIKKVFDYLMSIDLSNFKPDIERPKTTYFNELIELSLPIETQFFIYLIEKSNSINIEHTGIELFGLFKDFLKDCFTDLKYTTSMMSLLNKLKKLDCNGFEKVHKKNGNVWTFDILKCKEWAQGMGYIKKRLL